MKANRFGPTSLWIYKQVWFNQSSYPVGCTFIATINILNYVGIELQK